MRPMHKRIAGDIERLNKKVEGETAKLDKKIRKLEKKNE